MNETESRTDEIFWQRMAASYRDLPHSAPTSHAIVDDTDLDDLLLRYGAGELGLEEESCLRRLAAQNSDLAARMADALLSVRDVAAGQKGSAGRVWAQATSAPPGYSAPARIVDLAVRLLAGGLELLHSAGRPAYPALATRSSTPAPLLSVAQEFLTSAGIVDVIIDFRDALSWQLVARPKLLASPLQSSDLTIRLCDADGAIRGECPLTETGLVIDRLPPGEYELIVAKGDQERSRLSISCMAP